MLKIIRHNSKLVAIYSPDNGTEWLLEKIKNNEEFYLKGTYKIPPNNILNLTDIDENLTEGDDFAFSIGIEESNYVRLDKEVFNISINVFIEKSIDITPKFFTANRNISIISKLETMVKESFYIVTDESYDVNDTRNVIPVSSYLELIKSFPNNIELRKYSNMRISTAIAEYFNNLDEYKIKYENYLNKKILNVTNNKYIQNINSLKLDLLTSSQNELSNMIKHYQSYSEKNWQNKIKDILCVLFPKYLYAIREVNYGEINGFDKHPDFTLIDSNGYIDIMEIKKPDKHQIIRDCKNRNNYVPQKIFTDVIVQTTKYINALNQNHDKSKLNIFKKLKDSHPHTKFTIENLSINNPKGIILLGRSDKLSPEQKDDFELIKRQYKDIVEIMTYDDLLYRLDNLIAKLKQEIDR